MPIDPISNSIAIALEDDAIVVVSLRVNDLSQI
jgi:hypothetical protein